MLADPSATDVVPISTATSVRTILLVDDDRLVLTTLSSGLVSEGYRVVAAESVTEAEDLLASGMRPDLAIVDVIMPERSGLELARRLRDLDHIPFLLLTATADPKVVDEARTGGALTYIVKPIDVFQLVPAIEAALARAADLSDLRQTQQALQNALDADRAISVAIGIVMVRQGLDRAAAFEYLRRTARSRRVKLLTLARELIAGAEAV